MFENGLAELRNNELEQLLQEISKELKMRREKDLDNCPVHEEKQSALNYEYVRPVFRCTIFYDPPPPPDFGEKGWIGKLQEAKRVYRVRLEAQNLDSSWSPFIGGREETLEQAEQYARFLTYPDVPIQYQNLPG